MGLFFLGDFEGEATFVMSLLPLCTVLLFFVFVVDSTASSISSTPYVTRDIFRFERLGVVGQAGDSEVDGAASYKVTRVWCGLGRDESGILVNPRALRDKK